ncbi:hypothetical protein PoB_006083300 [Plakobranchus ocellatus]|uniref:Uncharacterized protein n=1 Tax=Plakobranchus ocellatus TaxID=259542 RepID=A0AAV4CR12_9GAST|nr:hypothetical protein PoB_006083300 [Plakobranchus ocellatus]
MSACRCLGSIRKIQSSLAVSAVAGARIQQLQKVLSPASGRTNHCLPQPTSSAAKSFHTKSACFFHSSNTPGMAAGPVDAENLKLLGVDSVALFSPGWWKSSLL